MSLESVENAPVSTFEAQFAKTLAEHTRALERVAASYARSPAEREDLLQDFALALWKALPKFEGKCSITTFVFRIAHNRAIAFASQRGGVAEDVDDHDVAATSGKNPAVAYDRKERESRLVAAVRSLPVGPRQVMMLLLEGLSHREIAEVLGTTENNVAVRASCARAAVRALIEADDTEAGGASDDR